MSAEKSILLFLTKRTVSLIPNFNTDIYTYICQQRSCFWRKEDATFYIFYFICFYNILVCIHKCFRLYYSWHSSNVHHFQKQFSQKYNPITTPLFTHTGDITHSIIFQPFCSRSKSNQNPSIPIEISSQPISKDLQEGKTTDPTISYMEFGRFGFKGSLFGI